MWDIVDLTRKILIGLKSRSTPKFALDVGAVIPLYLIGIKYSAISDRREATELILKYPSGEGLWDSIFAGHIVQYILDAEGFYKDCPRRNP
jgi:hypothetical protein